MTNILYLTLVQPLLKYLALVMCLLGSVFLGLGYFFEAAPDASMLQVSRFFYSIGSAVLGGGVFAAIMKSAQFSQLFQQHIFDVINDPAKMLEQDDVLKKWRILSSSILNRVLSESHDDAARLLEDKFLNAELDYHFEDFEASYDISLEEDGTTIKIINKMKAKLLISPKSVDPVLKQSISAGGSSKLLQLLINSEDQLKDAKFEVDKASSKQKQLKFKLKKFCPKGSSCKVNFERAVETTQNLQQEPYISATITRYILGGTVKAKMLTSGCRLHFVKTGSDAATISQTVQDPDGYERLKLAAGNELLLPGQGYIIMLLPDGKH